MPPTRDFKETVQERARREPELRQELLKSATRCVLNGEPRVGRTMLRDYIAADTDFDELSRKTGETRESLERMLSQNENPSVDNLLAIIAAIAEHENIELDVQVAPRGHSEQRVAA